eukprot:139480-Prorocentrum_minimum.AAC.3
MQSLPLRGPGLAFFFHPSQHKPDDGEHNLAASTSGPVYWAVTPLTAQVSLPWEIRVPLVANDITDQQ